MKVAILANKENSFVLPLAEGLNRSLHQLKVESKIFYSGLACIQDYFIESSAALSEKIKKTLIKQYRDFKFNQLMRRLEGFDLIVVVGHIPAAFMHGFIRDSLMREVLSDIPIVLYSNYYLPTRGLWSKYLKQGNKEYGIDQGGHYGLERYDYYLCSSVVSEFAMPPGPQPYSLIGINLNNNSLYPEQEEFVALLDFERYSHLKERKIQIQALEETNTKYLELRGEYSIQKIREVYRKCSIYFLAHRESFGLPICELQACGSYIFTPYSEWCPSHWLKEDLSVNGSGQLSPNFIVYNNDQQKLVEKIKMIKSNFDPYKVVNNFLEYHPQLFYGDKQELEKFLNMVIEGKINSKSHKSYVQ